MRMAARPGFTLVEVLVVVLLLVAAFVWGITGRLAEKVAGRGILVRSGGVLEVVRASVPSPGDPLMQAANRVVVDSERCHAEIQKFFGLELISIRLTDSRFYHIDTCFCPLADGEAIWYPPAFDEYGQKAIREHVPRLIEVEQADTQYKPDRTVQQYNRLKSQVAAFTAGTKSWATIMRSASVGPRTARMPLTSSMRSRKTESQPCSAAIASE